MTVCILRPVLIAAAMAFAPMDWRKKRGIVEEVALHLRSKGVQ